MPSGAQSSTCQEWEEVRNRLERVGSRAILPLYQEHTGVADLLMARGRPSITLLLQERGRLTLKCCPPPMYPEPEGEGGRVGITHIHGPDHFSSPHPHPASEALSSAACPAGHVSAAPPSRTQRLILSTCTSSPQAASRSPCPCHVSRGAPRVPSCPTRPQVARDPALCVPHPLPPRARSCDLPGVRTCGLAHSPLAVGGGWSRAMSVSSRPLNGLSRLDAEDRV